MKQGHGLIKRGSTWVDVPRVALAAIKVNHWWGISRAGSQLSNNSVPVASLSAPALTARVDDDLALILGRHHHQTHRLAHQAAKRIVGDAMERAGPQARGDRANRALRSSGVAEGADCPE